MKRELYNVVVYRHTTDVATIGLLATGPDEAKEAAADIAADTNYDPGWVHDGVEYVTDDCAVYNGEAALGD